MKPAYLADMRSRAYQILLCHYIDREGLTDDQVNARLSQYGVPSSLPTEYRWRRALARDGFLEALDHPAAAHLTRWRLSERGKHLVQEDLAQLAALKTTPSPPVLVKEKTNRTITNLKSFLRSIRADDPW